MRRRSLAHVRALAYLPRRGCQRLLAHSARLCRRDHAHPQNALGGAKEIHTTRDRPPAISALFKEVEALQPLFLRKGWHVAVETAAGDLEAEQREPVLEPIERDEVAGPGHRLLTTEVTLDAEQAEGVEAGDDELALGADNPVDLAQELMRLVGEFQHVRQDDQVDAILCERKPVRVGEHLCRFFEVYGQSRRDPRAPQKRDRK